MKIGVTCDIHMKICVGASLANENKKEMLKVYDSKTFESDFVVFLCKYTCYI